MGSKVPAEFPRSDYGPGARAPIFRRGIHHSVSYWGGRTPLPNPHPIVSDQRFQLSESEYRDRLQDLIRRLGPTHLPRALDLLSALQSESLEDEAPAPLMAVAEGPEGSGDPGTEESEDDPAPIPATPPASTAHVSEQELKELLGRVKDHFRERDWRTTLEDIDHAVRARPMLRESLAVFQATCFLKIGLPEMAMKLVRELNSVRMAPRESFLIAKLMYELQVYDLAEKYLMQTIRKDPTHDAGKEMLQKLRGEMKTQVDPFLADVRKRLSPMITDVQPFMTGGMALVFKGFHQKMHRAVAIKALRPNFVGMAQAVDRFLLEAVTLVNLSHPNLVEVYSIVKDGPVVSYVMEFLEDAETSDQRVKTKGPYPWTDGLKVMVAVTDALTACHKRGIVHRDMKPDNILLLPDGKIKVIDLGAAEHGKREVQEGNVFAGNLRYSPPESLRRSILGPPADIYGLAVTFHDLVMGITGEQALPPDPSVFPEEVESNLRTRGVSRLFRDILVKCLSPNPDKRYPDAMALREALSQLPLVGPPPKS